MATKTQDDQEDFASTLEGEFKERASKRLAELQPMRDEANRLERLISMFNQADASAAPAARRSSGGSRRQDGRSRKDQVLDVIRENPGITVAQIGEKLGVDQKNYLYRVTGDLVKEGAVHKDGNGLFPGEAPSAAAAA